MVKLNKIYTKTGDDGTTGLGTGERRLKFDLRVECYGTVDETNAFIGLARLHTRNLPELHSMLLRIQNDLFDLGADLATPQDKSNKAPEFEQLRILESQVQRVEGDIDALNKNIAPLRTFVLPGGSPASAALHCARTVARRGERLIVQLEKTTDEQVTPEAIHYMNRLSDFLFVAARHANNDGEDDILWVPGENR